MSFLDFVRWWGLGAVAFIVFLLAIAGITILFRIGRWIAQGTWDLLDWFFDDVHDSKEY